MYNLAENNNLCPCSSKKQYSTCCYPLHEGKDPVSALLLMRSRYSAYALGFHDYIIQTTHAGSPLFQFDQEAWKKEITKFSQETTFNHLEILDFTEGFPFSSVTFAAHLSKGKRQASFTEKSYFENINGRFFYRNGLTQPGIHKSLEGPSPLNLLPLAYFGNPILFEKALPINSITKEIQDLIYKMQATMDALDGIGLAAPQVHHSLQLFLVRKPIEDEQGNFELGETLVFINPCLLEPSKETWLDYEACLSIPGLEANIARPLSISVEYTDQEGRRKEERATGLFAKALMHEMDHLNGILFYHHLEEDQQLKIQPFLEAIKMRFLNNPR